MSDPSNPRYAKHFTTQARACLRDTCRYCGEPITFILKPFKWQHADGRVMKRSPHTNAILVGSLQSQPLAFVCAVVHFNPSMVASTTLRLHRRWPRFACRLYRASMLQS